MLHRALDEYCLKQESLKNIVMYKMRWPSFNFIVGGHIDFPCIKQNNHQRLQSSMQSYVLKDLLTHRCLCEYTMGWKLFWSSFFMPCPVPLYVQNDLKFVQIVLGQRDFQFYYSSKHKI